jgi:hypothetical protein
MACHLQLKRLPQMILVELGEMVRQIRAENCTIRNLVDMSQSMTTVVDQCVMINTHGAQPSYIGRHSKMAPLNHLLPSKLIVQAVKMVDMAVVELLLMSVAEAELL